MKKNKKIFNKLIEKFWFVPHDALLRSLDSSALLKIKFKSPSLDIGCGNGQMSLLMYPNQKIDVGIDLDPTGAKEVGVYKKVIAADATKLSFKTNSFQTIISNSTFEHIPQDKKAVSEVARVLKKGGIFTMTVPSPYLQTSLRKLMNSDQQLKLFDKRIAHFHYRSEEEWTKIFEQNKLKVIFKKQYFPQP
ncbi:class I SAM-dependent methyltransferase, partial [Patescibacteria group bacterium]|nr:class I SAM-dependent methyltransferase [Patescibacteria group bacterium]